ncbi:MAG TPA: SapC family protein [Gammaproteobacteria bacterium]|nr:SapC family protein [Gammaproteobacteria bacterium]
MNITIPPGYKSLVALDKEAHKGKGVVSRGRHRFATDLNGIYVVAAEFVQAARHYPLVFAQDPNTGGFLPLAITGLNQDQNLFIGTDGEWEKDAYIPAYVRRWPFFGVRVTGEKAKDGNILICVDESGLETSSQAVFDAEGKTSTDFASMQTLISEMEGARVPTEHLCQSVKELDLLEPFEAHAFPKDGQEMRLRGMFRVNEDKLNELQGKDLKRLMKHGELSRIYAHLMSLDNFKLLMDRTAARQKARRLVS